MAQADSVPSAIQAPITGATSKASTKRRSADRRYFIGGSDARIIMGDDEAALLRLWREKRGEIEPEDLSGNLVVQLGVATEDLTGIALVPTPVQFFGRNPKLDNEIAGQILRFDLTTLLPPQPEEGGFIIAHNDAGVRATDEVPPIRGLVPDPTLRRGLLRGRVWVRGVIWGRNGFSLRHGLPPWLGLEPVGSCSFPSVRSHFTCRTK